MRGRKRLDFSDAHSRLHKVFYIHCPGYPKENWLRREIIKFGGKFEAFLSKDVHVLITNQQSCDRGSSLSNPPLTPLSPLSACTSSSRMWMDSPLSVENPPTTVITRGKALALQAAKTQCNGSTDVLENSKRLGVRVWSLESVLRVVKKAKREENRRSYRSPVLSKGPTHGAKTLKPPFLKVEDCSNRFKPLFSEFDDWPIMDYLDKLNLDPGLDHGKLITPSTHPLTPRYPSEPVTLLNPRVQPLIALHRLNKEELCVPLDPPAAAPAQLRGKGSSLELERPRRKEKRSKPSAARPEHKGILKKQLAERRGYCEACLCRYSCLLEHRSSLSHQEFIANATNFSSLDRIISECISLDRIVENFSNVMSAFSDSNSCSTEEVSSPLPNSNAPCLSPTYSGQQSPYTPSKVWDSARRTPQNCISFRPDIIFHSYTPHPDNKLTSPSGIFHPTTPDLLTQTDVESTPRKTKPIFTFSHSLSPVTAGAPTLGEEIRRSYTIPIDSPSHGIKPEITLLIPSSSPDPSPMEWCESISQIRPRTPAPAPVGSIPCKDANPVSAPMNEAVVETTPSFIGPDETPTRQLRGSITWLEDGKTPPLPKNMDPNLFKFINYPYRQSKVDAFKKLSNLL